MHLYLVLCDVIGRDLYVVSFRISKTAGLILPPFLRSSRLSISV